MKNFKQLGENLTFLESELIHPTHADGFVDSGDPVCCGRIAGVAAISAGAATDSIPVKIKGVFSLPVTSVGNGLSKGETVYFDPSAGTLSEDLSDVPFGIALEAVSAYATATIDILLFGATPGAAGYYS